MKRVYRMTDPRRLVVRLPGPMLAQVEARAAAAGLSVSEYTRRVLAEALADRGAT